MPLGKDAPHTTSTPSVRDSRRGLKSYGSELAPKVFNANAIPQVERTSKRNEEYRPNYFLTGIEQTTVTQNELDESLEIDLTEDEFNYAVRMTEHSMRRLTKSHIRELKSTLKPHPLVEKVLRMICILRGAVAPNWTLAQEILNAMTFKMEL